MSMVNVIVLSFFFNYIVGDLVIRIWNKKVCFPVILYLRYVVVNIMAARGLHGR